MKEAFNAAETAKNTYDTRESELEAALTAATADGSGATQGEKDQAQQDLDTHKATKAAIVDAFDDAKTARDDKDDLIKEGARARD